MYNCYFRDEYIFVRSDLIRIGHPENFTENNTGKSPTLLGWDEIGAKRAMSIRQMRILEARTFPLQRGVVSESLVGMRSIG